MEIRLNGMLFFLKIFQEKDQGKSGFVCMCLIINFIIQM